MRIPCLLSMTTAAVVAMAGGISAQTVDLSGRDVPLRPVLESVYRVGRAAGARWELYGNRVLVAFDGAGNLHVFDPQNYRVVVVSPNGGLVREVGVRGEGPGELRNPVGFAVSRDATTAVADFGQRAFLIYEPGGAFQRSVLFGSDALTSIGTLQADPRGGSVISTGQTMVMSQAPGGNGYQVVRGRAAADLAGGRSIVRFSLARGSQAREVYLGWEPPKREPAREAGRGAGAALGAARAFEPQLYSAVLPDGSLVLSDSTAYALKVIGPDGGVRGVFRRPLRPRPVTAAMQRAERERRLAELTSGGARLMMDRGGGAGPSAQQIEQMVRENLEALQFYPELPVVAGLAAGWTGKIWVERTPASGNGNGPVDVLGTTGEYLGTIGPEGPQIPDAFGPNGLVAYVERDPLDVVSITVRRLPPELR